MERDRAANEEPVVHGRDLAEEEGEIPEEVKHNLPPAKAEEPRAAERDEGEDEEEGAEHEEAMAAVDRVKGLNSGAPSR